MVKMKWNPNTNQFEVEEKTDGYKPSEEMVEPTEELEIEPEKKIELKVNPQHLQNIKNLPKNVVNRIQQTYEGYQLAKMTSPKNWPSTREEINQAILREKQKMIVQQEIQKRILQYQIKLARQKALQQHMLAKAKRLTVQQIPKLPKQKLKTRKGKFSKDRRVMFIPPHHHRPNPLTGRCMICGVKERRIL